MQSKLQITLRAARINRGFKTKDVAEITGKNVETIQKYERNSTEIPRDLMVRLLELYGVTSDDIFFGIESDFTGSYQKKIKIA